MGHVWKLIWGCNKVRKGAYLVSVLLFVSILDIVSATKEECEIGNGTWTTPTISQGDDPIKKTLQPFCKCDLGFYWNESSKACINDSELRCSQTGGNWTENECQCPEGTIKWTLGFGCDMPGPVSEENEVKVENSPNISFLGLSALVLLVLIGFGLRRLVQKE